MGLIRRFSQTPIFVKILFGMFAGLVFGFFCVWTDSCIGFVFDWITPLGELFMRSLKLIAVPLVFLSLVCSVGDFNDISALSRMGVRTIAIYIATTFFAVLLGLVLVNIVRPGQVANLGVLASITQNQSGQSIDFAQKSIGAIDNQPVLQFLVDIVPENMLGAMSGNSNMLQVIFIALIVGVAALMIGRQKSEPFIGVVKSLNAVIVKVIDIVMIVAPVGVFALMLSMVINTAGNMALISALGLYALTVMGGLLFLTYLFYPLLVYWFTDTKVITFLRAVWPVQLLAFSTSSSAATLPLTMKQSECALGVSPKSTSFVLPVGVTINMDGTALYQAVAVVFIAQVFGIELTFIQMLTVAAVTTLSSVGTPGIPGGSIVMTIMVLTAVGIPAEGLALIIGLDRPLDMLRTVVNVTGDMTVVQIVDKREKN